MRDRDLRASLEQIGVQTPGLEYLGELIDGRRKATMCAELHLRLDIHTARSLQEACSILWTRHPARALELAGASSVLELARLCSTSAVAVARELAANKPKKSRQRETRILDGQPYAELKNSKMIRRLFVLEPELYAYAREAAAQRGHRNVSRIVRDALWKEIALIVPNAPQFQPRRVQRANGPRAARGRRTG